MPFHRFVTGKWYMYMKYMKKGHNAKILWAKTRNNDVTLCEELET